jgi:hypothetical protein
LPSRCAEPEDPTTLGDGGVDRLALALAEPSVGSGDRMQQLEGAVGHLRHGIGGV